MAACRTKRPERKEEMHTCLSQGPESLGFDPRFRGARGFGLVAPGGCSFRIQRQTC